MTPVDTLAIAATVIYLVTLGALLPVTRKLGKLVEGLENLPSSKKNGNTYGDTK